MVEAVNAIELKNITENAECCCKAGSETVADDTAGKLRIGCLAVHTALYAGADIDRKSVV